ncbi:MAG: alanine--tRNA ligase [Anaerolineaceae bacterium]|nr:MAG: alanine--tRNA ligase [Anaerolineaceae bacterium]
MRQMTSAEVRQAFLDYFQTKKHKVLPSSSLVPGNDPTLLFANAGMVQFKDVFLGTDKRDYKRAATSQKCMRVSGKHNDLEEVGPSPRHHTFFEMLGNFSFGDYFKLEAMRFAWELLTEVYGLPAERLAVSIYEKDDESFDLWTEQVGISPRRVARLGAKDNFWQMAETGPCGPCSEIHWDKYPERGEEGIIESLEKDDDRFLEIWNLVFMQFNRTQADPTNSGQYDQPLPAPCVDTGMGLERIVSILQGAEANYETDLFMPIIERTQQLTGHSDAERDANIVPYRVIADHIRAAVFLIADGVLPGAKGRDSVCRLVLRRAARFGTKIDLNRPFLNDVAGAVIDEMGGHYPELVERADAIKRTIQREEERFRRTMESGLTELENMLADLPAGGTLSGDKAFFLKATLGLPTQVIKDIAEEHGYSVDMAGFDSAEEEHARVSGGGQAMGVTESAEVYAAVLADLQADGKLPASGVMHDPHGATSVPAEVIALIVDGAPADALSVGDKVSVVLDQTPFYVESGGQVSDTGTIRADDWEIEVEDTRRPVGGLVVHHGEVVQGTPRIGAKVIASVDDARRTDIIRNHTGTHLLHAALRNHLGTHVQQRGSLVAPDRLRFDFAHDARVDETQLRDIEREVNDIILANYPVFAQYKPLQQARNEGAMALFGEKYADVVRTVSIAADDNRYSYELCGGVHVKQTADIGLFVVVGEGSVSAGVRRVEALTGQRAIDYMQTQKAQLHQIAGRLTATPADALTKLEALQGELQASKKQVERLRREVARQSFMARMESLEQIGGVPVMILQLSDTPPETLREMSDWFRDKVDSGVFVAGVDNDGKPQLLVTVSDDLTKSGLHAGNIVKAMAQAVGGGGGGRPNMAQAGGKDSGKISEALDIARRMIAEARA